MQLVVVQSLEPLPRIVRMLTSPMHTTELALERLVELPIASTTSAVDCTPVEVVVHNVVVVALTA